MRRLIIVIIFLLAVAIAAGFLFTGPTEDGTPKKSQEESKPDYSILPEKSKTIDRAKEVQKAVEDHFKQLDPDQVESQSSEQ